VTDLASRQNNAAAVCATARREYSRSELPCRHMRTPSAGVFRSRYNRPPGGLFIKEPDLFHPHSQENTPTTPA
jgi:hypothetical protein